MLDWLLYSLEVGGTVVGDHKELQAAKQILRKFKMMLKVTLKVKKKVNVNL